MLAGAAARELPSLALDEEPLLEAAEERADTVPEALLAFVSVAEGWVAVMPDSLAPTMRAPPVIAAGVEEEPMLDFMVAADEELLSR